MRKVTCFFIVCFSVSFFAAATDTDLDGIPDMWEQQYGTNPSEDDAQEDGDLDGFSNLIEYTLGTDPLEVSSRPTLADNHEKVLAYWPLASNAVAAIGSVDGDPRNGASFFSDALQLDGKDAYVNFGSTLSVTGSLSYCVWFYPDQWCGLRHVLGKFRNQDDQREFCSFIGPARRFWTFFSKDGSNDKGSTLLYSALSPLFEPEEWRHVAVSWDSSLGSNGVQICIDGVLRPVAGVEEGEVNRIYAGTADFTLGAHDVFTVGKNDEKEVVRHSFHGAMAQLVLCNGALSELEMLEIFHLGRGGDLVAWLDLDFDLDGLPDWWERRNFGTVGETAEGDFDGDGLSNGGEFEHGTDPANPDSDEDGMTDGWESDHGFDPLDDEDANDDPDNDGLTNVSEAGYGTDPHDADTDGDTLSDGDEVHIHETYPTVADSDVDGYEDGVEIRYGADPRDASSIPIADIAGEIFYTGPQTGTVYVLVTETSNEWNSIQNIALLEPDVYLLENIPLLRDRWLKVWCDSDNDGSNDFWEAQGVYTNNSVFLTNDLENIVMVLTDPDTDGDGLPDWWEVEHFEDLDEAPDGDFDGDGVSNEEEYQSGEDPTVPNFLLPPDPATVAPPPERGVVTILSKSIEFLYTGDNPIQTGVDTNAMNPTRLAVVCGLVADLSGDPLPGVNVQIDGHPEFGQTLSREDGRYDMAVNGGGYLTINFEKEGRLNAQRTIKVPWQDFRAVEDVALVAIDSVSTVISLGVGATDIQVASGSVISDNDGERRSSLFFPAGLGASIITEDGVTQQVDQLTVRLTEYTVGENGPLAMPAEMPPGVGYTYCVELSADEALNQKVGFDRDIPLYVDNFLNFPVGMPLPLAYYDYDLHAWVPESDGVALQLLGTNENGLAEMDLDGDGLAEEVFELAEFGITDDERLRIVSELSLTGSYWRVQVDHFTPYDINPIQIPTNAIPPDLPRPDEPDPESDPDEGPPKGGSVEKQNRVFRETLPVSGTPFGVNYTSQRVPGMTDYFGLDIPLSLETVPAELEGIVLKVHIAGQNFITSFPPVPNLSYTFRWDGKDAYGRTVFGRRPALIDIGYVYDATYVRPNGFARSFGIPDGVSMPSVTSRFPTVLWQTHTGLHLGGFDARTLDMGGWSLGPQHVYDPQEKVLYSGGGSARGRGIEEISKVTGLMAGNGDWDFSGDGGPATSATLDAPMGIAVGADGTIYIADAGNQRIRKVSTDGVISTFAGTGVSGYSGDGGLATDAELNWPHEVAVGPDGSVYIADVLNYRIRKVTPDGIISTVVGTGYYGYSGDGGLATEAEIDWSYGVAVTPDGTLYISDLWNSCIRRVGPDGRITTCAGNQSHWDHTGDGGLAVNASLPDPKNLTLGSDGSLYVTAGDGRYSDGVVRKISPEGIISTVFNSALEAAAGDVIAVAVANDSTLYISESSYDGDVIWKKTADGTLTRFAGEEDDYGYNGEQGPASRALLVVVEDLELGPDGALYMADKGNERVRRLDTALEGFRFDTIDMPSEDGSQVYRFDPYGRHLSTVNAVTEVDEYLFDYNSEGLLVKITDGDGLETVIERDVNGAATAVVAPFGQRTVLSTDANGWLTAVQNPEGETVEVRCTPDGLLTNVVSRRGYHFDFEYDEKGHLLTANDPLGAFDTLESEPLAGGKRGYKVVSSTAENRTTEYRVERTATDIGRSVVNAAGQENVSVDNTSRIITNIAPDGTESITWLGPDPRFGMQAALPVKTVTRLPSGLQTMNTMEQTVALNDPDDLLSVLAITNRSVMNGRESLSVYTAADRTTVNTSPLGRQSLSVADAKGRGVHSERPGFLAVDNAYDSMGRLSRTAQGDRTTAYAYNEDGYLHAVTNAMGQVNVTFYDEIGRVTNTVRPDGLGVQTLYDNSHSPVRIVLPNGAEHRFDRNEVNLETLYTPPDVGPGDESTLFVYNADRQLVAKHRPDGTIVSNAFDAAGRLQSIVEIRDGQTQSIETTYDAAGRVGSVERGSELIEYSYDGSLLTDFTFSGFISGHLGMVYNNDLQVRRMNYPNGTAIDFSYDDDGALTAAGELELQYDPLTGQLINTLLAGDANAVSQTYAYTGYGELQRVTAAHASELFACEYAYDTLGRITNVVENDSYQLSVKNYQYDVLGRIVSASTSADSAPLRENLYFYDANGNRLQKTEDGGETTEYTYDAQDRLLSTLTDSTNLTAYSYNLAGDLLSVSSATSAVEYEYDSFGNLLSADLNGTAIEYIIDAKNRRIGKKVNGTTVQRFIYKDQLNPVAELNGSGSVVATFIYAEKGNVPTYMVKGGETYRVISDHLGSVRLVVNTDTGEIAQRMDYDEFGNVLQDTTPGFQPFGFAGGLYDRDTGLVRFGARDYDSKIGRWLTKDRIRFSSGDVNLYVYCLGDPVNCADPSGYATMIVYSSTKIKFPVTGHAWVSITIGGRTETWGNYMFFGPRDDSRSIRRGLDTQSYEWEVDDIDAQKALMHMKRPGYNFNIDNCTDRVELALSACGIDYPSFDTLWISDPRKLDEWLSSLGGGGGK